MSRDVFEQIRAIVLEKKQFLITFAKNPSGDAIASGLALFSYLKHHDKKVDLVSDAFTLPHQYKFLNGAESIQSEFKHLQKFIISVNVQKTGVEQLSYDVKNNDLRIFITPKHGYITAEDIHTAQTDFTYEAIITFGAPDLPSLGALYENNTDLFLKTPLINIDAAPGNEQFGHVNLVDMTATSVAEVVFHVLKKINGEEVDADIATALLTGIIARTNSFKSSAVKPATLTHASELIRLGADREYIVKQLFQTKSIGALKLWGTALQHLKNEPSLGLVSTSITRDDFVRSHANETELYTIIDELIANAPEAKLILLLHEHRAQGPVPIIHAIMRSQGEKNAKKILERFDPQGDEKTAMAVIEGKSLEEVEAEIISLIR